MHEFVQSNECQPLLGPVDLALGRATAALDATGYCLVAWPPTVTFPRGS